MTKFALFYETENGEQHKVDEVLALNIKRASRYLIDIFWDAHSGHSPTSGTIKFIIKKVE